MYDGNHIPVIDLFAGPGGLGEGFSAYQRNNHSCFKIRLSVEKDSHAHKTLELRSFFRQFDVGRVPEDYYLHIQGRISRDDLFSRFPDAAGHARREAWHAELGAGSSFDDEIDRRIQKATLDATSWVLIGGPPCQAYSIIGRARVNKENDHRNYLYLEYLRILARHRPTVFVMENVKGILSSRIQGERIFDHIIRDLTDPQSVFPQYISYGTCRYRIFSVAKPVGVEPGATDSVDPKDFVVACEKYGIPQARHRVILLGIRDDCCNRGPEILAPEPAVSIDSVIADLPRIRSGLSREVDNPAVWRQLLRDSAADDWIASVSTDAGEALASTIRRLLQNMRCPLEDRGGEFVSTSYRPQGALSSWYADERLKGVCNHSSRSHIRKDIYRYVYAAAFASHFGVSPKLPQFPKELLPEHKNAASGHFNDRFRVQAFGRPATTITSHISKDGHYYIHPDASQARSLTVREAARLQTFPDNYFFCGNRTQQYTQVGNAVPPLLAYKIARIVDGVISRNR